MKDLSYIILKSINKNSNLDYDTSRNITKVIIEEFSKEVNQCITINQIKSLLK